MEIKIFEQRTCESCLAVCMMSLLKSQKEINLSKKEEYNILFEGLKFTKLDFSTGHLAYLAKKIPDVIFEQHIDFPVFYDVLKKLKLPENLKLHSTRINLKLLKELIKINPVIIYIDQYTLDGIYHYSHFVILSCINNDVALIHDPWTGEEIKLKTKNLMRSISYVRNRLKISPKLIRIL